MEDHHLQADDEKPEGEVGCNGKRRPGTAQALDARVANSLDDEHDEPDPEREPDGGALPQESDGAEQERRYREGRREQDPQLTLADPFQIGECGPLPALDALDSACDVTNPFYSF